MHRDKFGDSYDIVKQSILRWLASCGKWVVHPMITGNPSFAEDYYGFLNVGPVLPEPKAFRQSSRKEWIEIAKGCQCHLFLDPNTGLRQDLPNSGQQSFLKISELADIAKADARRKKLTLVFDQSIDPAYVVDPRIGKDRKAKSQARLKWKLRKLKEHCVHGVAYNSHAKFILVSANENVLKEASETLFRESGLPAWRLIGREEPAI